MDYRVLLGTRLLRAFGFGFSIVLLGVHLERRHVDPALIGILLTIGLASAATSSLVSAWASNRLGRRRILAACGLLMALTGLDLALATETWLLLLAGVTGMLGASSIDQGPFSAVEQAVLAESVPADGRNVAFARYSMTGALAASAGGLASGLGTDLARSEAMFVVYAGIGILTAILPLLLSARVEVLFAAPAFGDQRPLLGLYGLMALDGIGGGLIVNSVIAYWLHVRFGAGTEILGPTFAAMSLLQAGSYELSGRMANWFGLVNTMVFTHLPSNLLILAVPFAPNLEIALALLLVRFAISQMDIPARQAYLVSVVPQSERAGVVAISGAVRSGAGAIGPVLAGAAIQAAALGVPFFVGGAVKIVYDLGLFLGYRNRAAEHERGARAKT